MANLITADTSLLQGALDASEHHVLITDRKGRIVFANLSLAERHGRVREELIGESVEEIVRSDNHSPAQLEEMRQAMRNSRPIRVVVRGVHSSGSPLWLSLNITPLLGADGKASHFVGIATDITQSVEDSRIKKELQASIETREQERDRLALELRTAQKLEAVGRLASGVAHEINTPMQFVSDNLAFLGESVGDLASVIEAYRVDRARGDEVSAEVEAEYLLTELPKAMQRARDGVKRVTDIVRAMKEFSHPNAQARSPADINKAMRTTLEVARSEYKHAATVELDLAPLPLVPCNISELNQVFLNMLVNAAHAIEASGKDLSSGRIGITTRHEGAELTITFEDNGCGIQPEILDKIFDPFFTTKELGKGTGQGLAISRSIVVDRHGGALDVHSIVGTGTRFTIRLPVTPTQG
ncbi:MAG: putative sensor signal transduction histidine kinase [Steroidobacteraceae bacterium]|jgi:PAS domain S-box-containing protein|nr:putative sensor signal transduction histidine kinase [Steroidobacteraceae bacterium]